MPPKDGSGRTRRTVKACVICHKKKVRCDIDEVTGEICTPCGKDGYECVPRERKRRRFTFSPSPPSWPGIRTPNEKTAKRPKGSTEINGLLFGGASDTRPGYREKVDVWPVGCRYTHHSPVSAQEYLECSTPGQIPPRGFLESSRGSPPKAVSYLGRLEYLRNDVPVNDDAGLPNRIPR